MKEPKYTILDTPYLAVIRAFAEYFHRKSVPYSIVGNCGVQITLANELTKGREPIKNHAGSLERILRKTGDIDLAIEEGAIQDPFLMFNMISAQSRNLFFDGVTHRTAVASARKSRVIVNYQTKPEDLKGMPDYYGDIIKSSARLTLFDGNQELRILVAKPEYLIAVKALRLAEKDIYDITTLLKNCSKINPEEIRGILKGANKEAAFERIKRLIYDI